MNGLVLDEFSKKYPNKSQSGKKFRLKACLQCCREKGNPSYRQGERLGKSQKEDLGSERHSQVLLSPL